MIEAFVGELSALVTHYGAFGVFLATLAEEVIAPIPSAAIIAGAAFFLFQDTPFSFALLRDMFILLALPGALGMTLGSLVYYGAVYRYGKPFVLAYGPYAGVRWEDIERVRSYFSRGWSDELIFFTLRAAPFMPSLAVNVIAGLVRYDLRIYLVVTFLGNMVHAYAVGFLGWYAAETYGSLALFDTTGKALVAAGVLALGAYLLWRRIQKNPTA